MIKLLNQTIFFLTSVLVVLLFGCAEDEATCFSDNSNRPCLGAIEFLGQSEIDPLTLTFKTAFEDRNADLGLGELRIFINDQTSESSIQDLREVFHRNGHDYMTTQGSLIWTLHLPDKITEEENQQFTILVGVRAQDEAELVSNLSQTRLKIDLSGIN